jgi:hypothetical protein
MIEIVAILVTARDGEDGARITSARLCTMRERSRNSGNTEDSFPATPIRRSAKARSMTTSSVHRQMRL